ncbi:hypothetical protein [Nonomuraea sp. NPDC049158]|uniref:hypothetical protein n=1 Tax=Nonomuraea sp. NPDC049158 TaxID=3155649 RepID=UPI0033EC6F4D
MIGTSVARLAVTAGLEVVLSNSRGPETLADLVAELGGACERPHRQKRHAPRTWWWRPSR